MVVTVTEVISEVERLIGEAPGIGVQTFSEDGWIDALNRAFDLVFTKYPWPMFSGWDTVTLDGTTGKITTDTFTDVNGIEDFLSVNRAGHQTQLPRLSRMINPSTLTGSTVQCFTYLRHTDADYVGKRLKFFPITAEGDLDILTAIHPGRLIQDDDIILDRTMLVHATAWMALTGEDLNPTQADAQRMLFEGRFSDITGRLARHPQTAGGGSGVPTSWQELP